MAAQGAFGTDFYDRYYRSGRPVIKIGPKCALGSHEVRQIHSAPSLGQSIVVVNKNFLEGNMGAKKGKIVVATFFNGLLFLDNMSRSLSLT